LAKGRKFLRCLSLPIKDHPQKKKDSKGLSLLEKDRPQKRKYPKSLFLQESNRLRKKEDPKGRDLHRGCGQSDLYDQFQYLDFTKSSFSLPGRDF
jgi:hypothetical protein